jgi:lysozyme family protein
MGDASVKANFKDALAYVLEHEGGFVNHPKDPGGATNKGVTIGTLKRIGIDVDGDGDSDIADLKALRPQDLERVYRLFYWDKVNGDQLPSGLDYTVFDFAVNGGPSRAVMHLQRALGVKEDGDMGPVTLDAAVKADTAKVIKAINASRLRFMRALPIWSTFGNGWSRRVADVQEKAIAMASKPVDDSPAPQTGGKGFWETLIMTLAGIFRGKA